MTLKEYQNTGHPLPDTASFRQAEKAKQAEQAKAPASEGDWRSKLAQWGKDK